MRLEDDPSIGAIRCPWCGVNKGIPCVVVERRAYDEPDRKYVPSHLARMEAALPKLIKTANDGRISITTRTKAAYAGVALEKEIEKRRRSKYKDWNQTKGRMQR